MVNGLNMPKVLSRKQLSRKVALRSCNGFEGE